MPPSLAVADHREAGVHLATVEIARPAMLATRSRQALACTCVNVTRRSRSGSR